MGYTHHWTPSKTATPEQFSQFVEDTKKIIAQSPYIMGNGMGDEGSEPIFTDTLMVFNGINDQGQESLAIKLRGEWESCKTDRKDYDEIVGAVLLRAYHLGVLSELSSDGGLDDWEECIELYGDTFGEIPTKVPDDWDRTQIHFLADKN